MTPHARRQGRDDRRETAGTRSPRGSLVAMLSLAVLAGACMDRGGGDGSPGTTSDPTDRFGRVVVGSGEPLQLGILLGLSGPDPTQGIAALHGVQLAVDYLDGSFDGRPGPLMDHRINLEIQDDGCSAAGSRVGADELAADPRVVGVIGMSCSTEAVGGADRILSDRGVLLISPANTEPGLTDQAAHQPFFLRTAYNARLDGVVMADFAGADVGAETAAVVSDPGERSQALADAFAGRFEAGGGTITSSATPANGGDLDQVLADAGESAPAYLFVPGSDPACATIIRQAPDAPGLGATTFGSSAECEGSFRVTPREEGGAFLSTRDPATIETGEFYRFQFVPAYESQFGAASTPIVAAYAFDAASILFDAIQVAAQRSDDGSVVLQRSALREAIFATDSYEGLTGSLTCTPLGDCAAAMAFAVYLASEVPADGQEPAEPPVFTEVLSVDELGP